MTEPRGRRPGLHTGVRRRRRHRRARARRRRALVVLLLLGVAGLATLAAGLGGAAAVLDNCSLSALRPVSIGEKSYVYDANDRLLGAIPSERNRQPVDLRNISTWMRKATIAVEDRRFYSHSGVDFEGILRAAVKDIEAGRPVEGASTITQQLVRNLYPISRERTLERKVKEACLAVKLNRRWTKDQILEEYLNAVYYGNRAYGVKAAARTYFSREPTALTLPQAALLAGLTQAPSQYDPFVRPDDALRRRNVVLRTMLESGNITQRQYREAVRRPLALHRGDRLYTIERVGERERYFFNYVYDELVAQYGASTVRSGGLRVYTTVDPRLQQAAAQAIKSTLNLRGDPAAAVVAIDPGTGAIRAMTAVIPGRKGNQFNLASQARRQAGSTFKTFVLAAAVAEGVDPDSTYYQSEYFVYNPDPDGSCEDDTWWCVSTYDRSYSGRISIADATLKSDNTVFAKLTLDLGPEKVAAMAQRLGIRTKLPPFPSMGLGSIAVSPLEMASAYATLAAGGVYSKPTAIRKVVLADEKEDPDAGWGVPVRRRVIPDWVAAEVTEILRENMKSGTGTAARFGRPAAGKTGTTDRHSDAWFCGYTPALSATVWVGYPRAEIPMENVHGISVAGGTFPAQIWHRFMRRAVLGTPLVDFPPPRSTPVWREFDGQYASESYTYDYDYEYDYDDDSSGEYDEPESERTEEERAPAPQPSPRPTPPPVATDPAAPRSRPPPPPE
ncbi:MAG: penicillin-binding protein [Thermoleophilia bacterium]|nr:penicillin-binding protein [Thermoleophilia bacterium]